MLRDACIPLCISACPEGRMGRGLCFLAAADLLHCQQGLCTKLCVTMKTPSPAPALQVLPAAAGESRMCSSSGGGVLFTEAPLMPSLQKIRIALDWVRCLAQSPVSQQQRAETGRESDLGLTGVFPASLAASST